mgnify:CR=1 FL=1
MSVSLYRFDERQLKEIHLCLYYVRHLAHGTPGHNRMVLIAELALELGFKLDGDEIILPSKEQD